MRRFFNPLAWAVCLVLLAANLGQAEDRPITPQLLPKLTLAYARAGSVPELVEKFQASAMGKIFQEKEIAPLVGDLYSFGADSFQNVQEDVGLALEELLGIPQGEICIALVGPPQGVPALVVMLEAKGNMKQLNVLIEKAEAALAEDGAVRSTENFAGVELIIHETNDQSVIYFRKDGVFVATTNLQISKDMLTRWAGEIPEEEKLEEDKTSNFVGSFAQNDRFKKIMRRCQVGEDDRPQLTFFVDPIALAKVSSRGNFGAQTTLALLPVIGIDGVQAIGGTVTLVTEDFDAIIHAHALMDSPREGVLKMLAMQSGDIEPENWVPEDAASYTTLHWNFSETIDTGRDLFNSFRGEEALEKEIESRLSEPLGLDFKADILDQLEGRVTYVTWIEPVAQIGAQANLVGVKIKNPEAMQATLNGMAERFVENVEKKSYASISYYQGIRNRDREGAEPREEREPGAPRVDDEGRRRIVPIRPQPCIALVGDYLMIADRPSMLQAAIDTKGKPGSSLGKQLDFKLIGGKIKRISGDSKPGMISFSRPEKGMKLLYDIVRGDDVKQFVADRVEGNDFFKRMDKTMADNPLPPFKVIEQYLAPSGATVTSDETGFHYTAFTLRRKQD